ncbi:hypothetical protein, partial [Akkermansia sp. KLE1797]
MKRILLATVCFSWGLTSCTHHSLPSQKEDSVEFTKNQRNDHQAGIANSNYKEYRNRLLKQLKNQEKLTNRTARNIIVNGVPVVQWEPIAKSPDEINLRKMIEEMPEFCKRQLAASLVHSQNWRDFIISGRMLRSMNKYKDVSVLLDQLIFSEIRKKDCPCRESKNLLEFYANSENISPLWIFEFTMDWHIKGHPDDESGWNFLKAFMLYEEDETPFFSRICSFVLEKNLDRYPEGKTLVEYYRLGILEYQKKLPLIIKS